MRISDWSSDVCSSDLKASGDAKKDLALIGQFGVGFYSAFMVADEVEVLTRRAGEDSGWRWVSDGKGEFTVAAAEATSRGPNIVLHPKKGADEFPEPNRHKQIVAQYSHHNHRRAAGRDRMGKSEKKPEVRLDK